MAFSPSLPLLISFALLFGFTSGAVVSLMTASLVDVAGGHVHNLGTILGTYFSTIAFAALTGLPLQGAIASGPSSMVGLIVFSGAAMLLGAGIVHVGWYRVATKAQQPSG
jgi:MFS transporter, MCT family, solute carrier family 16 (monocarboxylic acid transporters), member 10